MRVKEEISRVCSAFYCVTPGIGLGSFSLAIGAFVP